MHDPLAETETTRDLLVGGWFIHQLRRGHRFNTDDLLLAWLARRERPDAETVLDLGCGVGSVGLLTLAGLSPRARLVGVEAQAVSAALYRRTLADNGLDYRVTSREGDLRDPSTREGLDRFDLVLGNPPYLPEFAALRSPNPQRAAARLELRGDVFDYARVAAEHLAPNGVFGLVHSARDPRPERAIAAAGLTLRSRQDVVFRHGQPPMIALFTAGFGGERHDAPPLAVRGEDGAWTAAYQAVRAALGLG
ncbi:methyltransferase [Myxococcota bacterium]|nr:methyltransferase [Myxococcota bacterium]